MTPFVVHRWYVALLVSCRDSRNGVLGHHFNSVTSAYSRSCHHRVTSSVSLETEVCVLSVTVDSRYKNAVGIPNRIPVGCYSCDEKGLACVIVHDPRSRPTKEPVRKAKKVTSTSQYSQKLLLKIVVELHGTVPAATKAKLCRAQKPRKLRFFSVYQYQTPTTSTY